MVPSRSSLSVSGKLVVICLSCFSSFEISSLLYSCIVHDNLESARAVVGFKTLSGINVKQLEGGKIFV
jgi:hypothetical protein